jgi:hypothetical protein
MKHYYYLLLFLFFTICANPSIANISIYEKPKISAQNEPQIKLDLLQCFNQLEIHGSSEILDSCVQVHIAEAKQTFNQEMIIDIYLTYLENLEHGYIFKPKKVLDVIQIIKSHVQENINLQGDFKVNLALSKAYYTIDENKIANEYAIKALLATSENSEDHIIALINTAKCLQNINKSEGFQHLFDSKYQINKIDEPLKSKLTLILNKELFEYNYYLKNEEEVFKILNETDNILQSFDPKDSLAIMWNAANYITQGIEGQNKFDIENKIEEILAFTEKHNYNKLKYHCLGLLRSYLLETENYSLLSDLYKNRYPGLLEQESKLNPCRYCTLQAYFYEVEGNIDSAIIAFDHAESELKSLNEPQHFVSNFYKRKGEFYLRNGYKDKAIYNLEKAFEIASNIPFAPFSEPLSKKLMDIYESNADYQNSAKYSKLYTELAITRLSEINGEQLLKIQIDYQKKEREYEEEKLEQINKRKLNTQFFALAAVILFLLLLLAIISSMQIPAWSVEMLGFFFILFLFEFIILVMDHYLHEWTHGMPIKMFLIKICVISVLYPLHHLIEFKVISYLKSNDLIGRPSFKGIKNMLSALWPWLRDKNEDKNH